MHVFPSVSILDVRKKILCLDQIWRNRLLERLEYRTRLIQPPLHIGEYLTLFGGDAVALARVQLHIIEFVIPKQFERETIAAVIGAGYVFPPLGADTDDILVVEQ